MLSVLRLLLDSGGRFLIPAAALMINALLKWFGVKRLWHIYRSPSDIMLKARQEDEPGWVYMGQIRVER